jgi:hypothetical protein
MKKHFPNNLLTCALVIDIVGLVNVEISEIKGLRFVRNKIKFPVEETVPTPQQCFMSTLEDLLTDCAKWRNRSVIPKLCRYCRGLDIAASS